MNNILFIFTVGMPLLMPAVLWHLLVGPTTSKLSEEFNQKMKPYRLVMNIYTIVAVVGFIVILYFHFK